MNKQVIFKYPINNSPNVITLYKLLSPILDIKSNSVMETAKHLVKTIKRNYSNRAVLRPARDIIQK